MTVERDFDDLDEIELEDLRHYLRETLGLFNNFSGHEDELSDELKGVIITLEDRLEALNDALELDASNRSGHTESRVENPLELVLDVGSGNTFKDFENLDFHWLQTDKK